MGQVVFRVCVVLHRSGFRQIRRDFARPGCMERPNPQSEKNKAHRIVGGLGYVVV